MSKRLPPDNDNDENSTIVKGSLIHKGALKTVVFCFNGISDFSEKMIEGTPRGLGEGGSNSLMFQRS